MWAAIKSDLAEFATGAAEETNAVASKVGVNLPTGGDGSSGGSGVGSGLDGGGYTSQKQPRGGADGSVLFANAALSMGEKGLKGLSSVSSMVGGIVAPRGGNENSTNVGVASASSSSASSFASAGGGNLIF